MDPAAEPCLNEEGGDVLTALPKEHPKLSRDSVFGSDHGMGSRGSNIGQHKRVNRWKSASKCVKRTYLRGLPNPPLPITTSVVRPKINKILFPQISVQKFSCCR